MKPQLCHPLLQPCRQTGVTHCIPPKSYQVPVDALVFCHFAQKAAIGTDWKREPQPMDSLATHHIWLSP